MYNSITSAAPTVHVAAPPTYMVAALIVSLAILSVVLIYAALIAAAQADRRHERAMQARRRATRATDIPSPRRGDDIHGDDARLEANSPATPR